MSLVCSAAGNLIGWVPLKQLNACTIHTSATEEILRVDRALWWANRGKSCAAPGFVHVWPITRALGDGVIRFAITRQLGVEEACLGLGRARCPALRWSVSIDTSLETSCLPRAKDIVVVFSHLAEPEWSTFFINLLVRSETLAHKKG